MAKTYEALLKAGKDILGNQPGEPAKGDTATRHNEKLNRDLQKLNTKLHTLQEDYGVRVVLFSSLGKGSGVTFVVSQIARVAARSSGGLPVLLLDADYSHPRLHKYFGFRNDAGLTGILRGEARMEDVVHREENARLDVIAYGNGFGDLPYTRMAERLQEFLATYRNRYQWIFIDAPAYNASAEMSALAKCTDGAIMVVPQGRVKWFALKAVQQDFTEQHIPILGGIINFREYYIPHWLYRFT